MVSLYLMQPLKKLRPKHGVRTEGSNCVKVHVWITFISCLLVLIHWHRSENPDPREVHQTSVYRIFFFGGGCLFSGGHFAVTHNNKRLVQTSHFRATINAIVAQVKDVVRVQTGLLDVECCP